MGACQCRLPAGPLRYDLRKRQEKVGASPRSPIKATPVEKFHSLRNSSCNGVPGSASHSTTVTPCGTHGDTLAGIPRDDPPVTPSAVIAANLDICHSISSKTTLSDHPAKDKNRNSLTESMASSGGDSDLGSECLSESFTSRINSRPSSARSGDLAGTRYSPDPVLSLASDELGQSHTSEQFMFGTIGERQYVCSRLGSRQNSASSTVSQEILQWKKGNKLGSGSFGTVYLGLTVTGELIAVKQVELIETEVSEAEKEYAKIYREVTLLKAMRHKNIVRYLGSSYERGTISVFMQFVAGGSLSSILQRFGPLEENITSRYTRQLLDAVTHLHVNNIVHRDIKSGNIMLMPEGIIKLIDFGCAKRLALRLSRSGSYLQQSLKGTPYWMAPEVINETGHGKKSDIWSLGCTVYELCTATPPWGDREPIAAIYAIGSEEFAVPSLPETFAPDTREFVRLCLIRDTKKRPAAAKLMKHPFINRPQSSGKQSAICSDEINERHTRYHRQRQATVPEAVEPVAVT